jgi:phosphoenolpyruvate carboxylase
MSYKIEFVGHELTLIYTGKKSLIKKSDEIYKDEINQIEHQIQVLQDRLKESKANYEKVCKHDFYEYNRGCDKCKKCGRKEYYVYAC